MFPQRGLSGQLSDSVIAIKEGITPEIPELEPTETPSAFDGSVEDDEEILMMPSPISFEEAKDECDGENALLAADKIEEFSKLSQPLLTRI